MQDIGQCLIDESGSEIYVEVILLLQSLKRSPSFYDTMENDAWYSSVH